MAIGPSASVHGVPQRTVSSGGSRQVQSSSPFTTQMTSLLSGLGGGGSSMGVQQLGTGATQGAARPGTPEYTAQVQAQQSGNAAPSSGGGFNFGAGGSASGSGNPAVTYNPESFSVSSQENPQLAALLGDMKSYRGQLAGNTDQEATQALQRQRDLTSGMAKEFGQEAASRGIYGSGAASQDMNNRLLEPATQSMGQLNAALTSDARKQQRDAMGQEAGAIGQQAGITQAQQNFGLNSWQARSQAQLGAAQLEAMQRNNNTNNAMQLISLLGSLYS